jgi:hypothetical protein
MGRHPSVRLVRPYRPKDGALMTTAEDRLCWNDTSSRTRNDM